MNTYILIALIVSVSMAGVIAGFAYIESGRLNSQDSQVVRTEIVPTTITSMTTAVITNTKVITSVYTIVALPQLRIDRPTGSWIVATNGTEYFALDSLTHTAYYESNFANSIFNDVLNYSKILGYGAIHFTAGVFTFYYSRNISISNFHAPLALRTAILVDVPRANITIWGEGAGVTILKLADNQNCTLFDANRYSSLTIRDLTLDGDGANNFDLADGAAVILTGGNNTHSLHRSDFSVINVNVENSMDTGIYLGNNYNGTEYHAILSNVRITNSEGKGEPAALIFDTNYGDIVNGLIISNYYKGIVTISIPGNYSQNIVLTGIEEDNVQTNTLWTARNFTVYGNFVPVGSCIDSKYSVNDQQLSCP